jgi:hypothetical protein
MILESSAAEAVKAYGDQGYGNETEGRCVVSPVRSDG